MHIEVSDLKYNKTTGELVICGMGFAAHSCNYSIVERDNRLILILKTPTNDYILKSEPRTFFGGYGATGKLIKNFERGYPVLKAISLKILERENLMRGIIPQIEPPDGLLLKKGEYAIKTDTRVKFCQERTKTSYVGGGASIRISKGIRVGGGRASPIKKEYLATLDAGRLVLTNKRILFFGDRKSFTIQLNKLAGIERYRDSIKLTKENTMKKTIFVGVDGAVYAEIIEQLFNDI